MRYKEMYSDEAAAPLLPFVRWELLKKVPPPPERSVGRQSRQKHLDKPLIATTALNSK